MTGKYPQPGNWKKFSCFCWTRKYDGSIPDVENWTIYYTSNRNSGLLTLSNERVIDKALEPYTEGNNPDAISESHDHWACGYIDGYAIRCVDSKGEPTRAYETLCELLDRLAEYPVLDESDYSEREHEALWENLTQRLKSVTGRNGYAALPIDTPCRVMDWLEHNDPGQLENGSDDQGAYIADRAIEKALAEILGA